MSLLLHVEIPPRSKENKQTDDPNDPTKGFPIKTFHVFEDKYYNLGEIVVAPYKRPECLDKFDEMLNYISIPDSIIF